MGHTHDDIYNRLRAARAAQAPHGEKGTKTLPAGTPLEDYQQKHGPQDISTATKEDEENTKLLVKTVWPYMESPIKTLLFSLLEEIWVEFLKEKVMEMNQKERVNTVAFFEEKFEGMSQITQHLVKQIEEIQRASVQNNTYGLRKTNYPLN